MAFTKETIDFSKLNSDEIKKDKLQNNFNNIMLDNLALMPRIKESGEKN